MLTTTIKKKTQSSGKVLPFRRDQKKRPPEKQNDEVIRDERGIYVFQDEIKKADLSEPKVD